MIMHTVHTLSGFDVVLSVQYYPYLSGSLRCDWSIRLHKCQGSNPEQYGRRHHINKRKWAYAIQKLYKEQNKSMYMIDDVLITTVMLQQQLWLPDQSNIDNNTYGNNSYDDVKPFIISNFNSILRATFLKINTKCNYTRSINHKQFKESIQHIKTNILKILVFY